MANVIRELAYRCSDDCEASGCPSHIGRLEYQSCADAYTFTMNGKLMHLERGELDAMIRLLKSLNRADSASISVRLAGVVDCVPVETSIYRG